jgi:hypothetical protein
MRRRHRDICKRCQWFEPDALDTWVNQKGVVSPIVVIHQRNICRVGNQYNVDDKRAWIPDGCPYILEHTIISGKD